MKTYRIGLEAQQLTDAVVTVWVTVEDNFDPSNLDPDKLLGEIEHDLEWNDFPAGDMENVKKTSCSELPEVSEHADLVLNEEKANSLSF